MRKAICRSKEIFSSADPTTRFLLQFCSQVGNIRLLSLKVDTHTVVALPVFSGAQLLRSSSLGTGSRITAAIYALQGSPFASNSSRLAC
jgi:hypothetical protein